LDARASQIARNFHRVLRLERAMEPPPEDEPYLDPSVPGFVEDGERFDRPVRKRNFTKGVRSVAAVMVSAMLFAAGTPLSWVSVLTAILMLMIWISIGNQDHDDTI
jgi:hypothetical protein